MSGAHPDEEVAVTKRGRAVKLPAKYKAEVCPPPTSPPPPPPSGEDKDLPRSTLTG